MSGILAVSMLLTGCSGISQSDYDSLVSENSDLKIRREQLNEAYEARRQKYKALESDYEKLESDYAALESNTADWREYTDDQKAAAKAQAEKDRIEAEEAERKAQEEEEAQRKAEEEARLAEEAKGYETGITYDEIARTPDNYKGKKVKFSGRIIQIVEGSYKNCARMSTDGKYDDVIYITYYNDVTDIRLLEDDMVTIYGTFTGLYTYTSVLNSSITLPEISVDRIELNQ